MATFEGYGDEPSPNLVKTNPFDVLYLMGDEFTDGSIRLIIDEDSGVATVEELCDDSWNLTDFQLAQASLLLGRDIRVSASGHDLIVETLDDEEKHIVVSQNFDDDGSSDPESTLRGTKVIENVIQGDSSTEVTSTEHEFVMPSDLGLIEKLYVKVGETAALSAVKMTLTETPGDLLVYKQNFPGKDFPADTDVEIELCPGVEFAEDREITLCFTSTQAFTMRYDVTSTLLAIKADTQTTGQETLLTETLVLSNDLSIAFSNAGELVRGNKNV